MGATMDAGQIAELIRKAFPLATRIHYSCIDSDTAIWAVANQSGRLLWNWRTANERSWPEPLFGQAVHEFHSFALTLPGRGDGLRFDLP
jgi:hypothetical protein